MEIALLPSRLQAHQRREAVQGGEVRVGLVLVQIGEFRANRNIRNSRINRRFRSNRSNRVCSKKARDEDRALDRM